MKLVVRTEDQLLGALRTLQRQFAAHPDRGLLVSIDPYRAPRTGAQNAHIHVLVSRLADALGYSHEEMKDVVKWTAYPKKVVTIGAEAMSVPKSTSELSREEASVVIEIILSQAAEFGIKLGGPHEL